MRFAVARAFAIALLLPGAVRAQAGRPWTPGERVLITSFNELGAVATDLRRVFGASPNGIEIFDYVSQRWQAPTTEVDGYPAREIPTALTYDRTTDALLLATNTGTLYAYTFAFSRWQRRAALFNNPVKEMFVAQTGDPGALYINGAQGWSKIPPGSFIEQPVAQGQLPPDVARQASASPLRRAQSDPYLAAASATLTQDARLRRWPITGVALGDQQGQYWIATAGGNLFFFDGRFSRVENKTYGLLTRGVGAIGGDAGTLWFGGDGRGMRTGVTSADRALQTWQHFEPQYDNAPGGFVYDIAASGTMTWFAATDGVFRFDTKTRRWARFTEADGIPQLPALTLAPAQNGGVLVGGRGGVVQLDADGHAASAVALAGVAVNRILVRADTVWLATESGLWTLAGGVFNAHEQTPLRGSVLDVVAEPGVIVALAGDALYRRDNAGVWSGPLRDASLGRLGRLYRLAFDEGQLWVAGEGGAARYDEKQATWTYYQVGTDIPEGPVLAVKPDGPWIWLATPAGALHLKWRR
jgi:frataxin-like iron-binding protein CyaY